MRKEIKIQLEYISTPEITGSGNDLTISLEGHRINKAGNIENYKIQSKIGRFHIQRLARQIATMHERDRERLARELRRIEFEVQAIQQPEVSK